jgi:endonuclease YncB( thermonuclease family)
MGNTFTFTRPQPPKDPEAKGGRPSRKRILLAVVSSALAVTGIGIGVAAANNSATTTPAAPNASTPAARAPASSAPSTGSSIDPSSLATPGTGQPAATPNPTTSAADTPWTVTKIVDGDTVDVTKAGTTNRIRVIGIDTPEIGQCGYLEATANMTALLAGKHVNVVAGARDDVDRYGRYLRYLDVDGTDAGLRQIQGGLAVARYDSRDGYGAHPREASYIAADAASPNAPCTGAATPQPVPNKPANPAPVPVSPSTSWPLAGDRHPCPQAKPIKGNQSSMIAHSPGQQSYLVTSPEACFANLTDAAAGGYRPAAR